MRERLTTAAEVAGASLVTYGFSTFSTALGLIVGGGFLIVGGYLASEANEGDT